MSFELREHTADVAVEARGPTLGDAFASAADGMAAAMCDEIPPGGEWSSVRIEANSREALLFDYLDELIYCRDVQNVLPVDNDATVVEPGHSSQDWLAEGSFRGLPLSAVNAREIKAVTYSEMEIERTGDGWRVYVVFDV